MPILPSLADRILFLSLNQGPGPMLDFLGAQSFRAVSVAVELGVFEALSDGSLAAGQVAARIQASEPGPAQLVDALVTRGYLKRKDGRYANTRMTAGEIVAKVPLPRRARRLLDIGGGHGLYSIAFCRRPTCC